MFLRKETGCGSGFANMIVYVFMTCSSLVASQAFEESNFSENVQRWFEWGEYDIIIDEVSKRIDSIDQSALKARLHAYLGVAYFTDLKLLQANQQFFNAFEIDSTITLDKNYLSADILDFMHSAREAYKTVAAEKAREDSLRVVRARELTARQTAALDSINLSKHVAAVSKTRILTLSTLGIAGITAFIAAYEYARADDLYEKFVHAARQDRDLINYNEYKKQTELHDRASIVSAAVAVASTVTSAFLFRKLRTLTKKYQEEKQIRH